MSKLVGSYNFHRASNEVQKPAVDALLKSPEVGRIAIIADWKELMSLPLQKKASGESFFGSARKEISIFGAILTEHLPDSTSDNKVMLRTHVLVLSEILDHTALRTCQLLERALAERRSRRAIAGLDVISDCAGHFRSYENLHWAAQQAALLRAEVALHYGVEKHLKHDADRMFGWVNGAVQQLLLDGADIREPSQLQTALASHFQKNKNKDPTAPFMKVLLDDAAVPETTRKLIVPDLKISRSYCLSLQPAPKRLAGALLRNHVYSTRPVSLQLAIDRVEEAPGPGQWRRGYYGKGRSAWDTAPAPLGPHEEILDCKSGSVFKLINPDSDPF